MTISHGRFVPALLLAAFLPLASLSAAAANLQLISVLNDANNPPASADGDSYFPVISADGRHVLFGSMADNLVFTNRSGPVPATPPRWFNVFLRDRTTGSNTLVSVNPAGNGGDWNSSPGGISTNGQYALFESQADDLVPADGNNANDVFVRDLVQGETVLISINTNGICGNGASGSSVMTPDGRFIAFVSAATDLVAGDTNKITDVFVRDRQTGTTKLVSAGAMAASAGGSASPAITPDGRFVAFSSKATNLIPGLQLSGEVYVRDLVAGTTAWASTNARTLFQTGFGTTNAVSGSPAISADGRYVAFEAGFAYSDFRGMILRYDTQTAHTDIVHTNVNMPTDSSLGVFDLTPDGRFIAFVANTNAVTSGNTIIYLWDGQTGSKTLVSVNRTNGLPAAGVCDTPAVDASGRYVVFFSSASNLSTNSLKQIGQTDLYVRDLQAGDTRLLDADTNGVGVGAGSAFAASAAGRFVAFDLPAENVVPNDGNGCSDIFVCDLTTNAAELVSAHAPALPSLAPDFLSKLFSTSLSTNARYIAFASDANNLVANDTNRFRDIFVRDVWAGTNILVSAGTNGSVAAGISSEPAISGDGRFVAFSSFATNLVAGDTNRAEDVFRRDLAAGTNALVSISTNNGFGNASSFSPMISSDGKYVLFRSWARNLFPAAYAAGSENLFFRNLQSSTTYALTTNAVIAAAMTPDGHFIAYIDTVVGKSTFYVWDSQAAKRIYTNTAPSGSFASAAISADGRWIAYGSNQMLYAFDLIGKTNCSTGAGPFDSRAGMQFSANDRFLVFVTKTKVLAMDTNGTYDVYLFDLQTQSNLLVSQSYDSANAANGVSDSPGISPDGRFVAFRSSADNLVPDDINHGSDIFLYDHVNNAMTLVTVNQGGDATANRGSVTPVFSGDGHTLAFLSYAGNLPGGCNGFNAIFALNLSAPVVVDSDGDGMDDQWEMDHFGTLARDGTGDYDHDGVSDLLEFLAGTDPTDPASVFRAEISGIITPGQVSVITWPATPGKSYRVQFKNDLNDPDWQDLNGNLILVGNQGRAADLAPAASRRFYRILLNN